ncbi:MAG: protein-L-isoaspartate(D-aspartate) O-methyltransferase [Gemmatimonadetes bacterium]|nr:protein-L-isoaspartate(D-aspartate) O-methyltransferase [Gemmatimonadota bacterium]
MVARALGPEYRGARRRLVEALQDRGIRDLGVLRAFDELPRHLFVPDTVRHRSYEDAALPIGGGQTISQPYVHARAVEALALTGRERVLEIGTGSGFQTALLSRLSAQVFSVERSATLLDRTRPVLQEVGVRNASLLAGDGTLGWREFAPFDAIVVSAGAPDVPPSLAAQLAEGGRLLIPVGSREEQQLTLFTKRDGVLHPTPLTTVRFVPLVGAEGWAS